MTKETKKPPMFKNITEFNEILMDVLLECCGNYENYKVIIDNSCLRSYEKACVYLEEQGYLVTRDGRIYKLKYEEPTTEE